MQNLSSNPMLRLQPAPVFGAAASKTKPKAETVDLAKAGLKEIDATMQNVQYINVNEKPTDKNTPVSTGLNKLRKAGWPLGILLALAGMVTGGVSSYRAYNGAKPEAVVVQRDASISPVWYGSQQAPGLGQVIREADELGLRDAGTIRKLNMGLQSVMTGTILTLSQFPTHEVDQQMLTTIHQAVMSDASAMPDAEVAAVSNELQAVLRRAGINNNPGRFEIEKATPAIQEFVSLHPAFQRLSAENKGQLVNQIKNLIHQNAGEIVPGIDFKHIFTDTVRAQIAAASPSAINWNQFFSEYHGRAHTRQGAIALFEAKVKNTESYRSLTPELRQAFLKNGRVMLEALDHYEPSPLWGLFSGLAALGGLLGIAGTAIARRREIADAPGAFLDISSGLKNPTLFVTNADKANVEGGSRASELNLKIETKVKDMADTVQAVFASDPIVKEFIGEASRLPDAAYIRQRFVYPVALEFLTGQGLMEKLSQKPISQVDFYEKLAARVETGALLGNVFSVDTEALAKAKPEENSKEPVQKQFEAQRHWVDLMVTSALKSYSNAAFGTALAKRSLEAATRRKETLESEITALAEKGEQAKANEKVGLLERAEKDLEAAARLHKDADTRLYDAQQTMEEYIDPLREFRNRLTQAISDANFTGSIEDLKKIKDASGKATEDPKLLEALREQKIDKFLHDQEAANQKREAEIKAELAEIRKAKQEKAASAAAQA